MFNIPPVQIAIGGKSELRLTRKGYKRGVQEFRSSGVQEFRSSGVQEFRSSGVQEFRLDRTMKLQE
jgi:hypothetical protein